MREQLLCAARPTPGPFVWKKRPHMQRNTTQTFFWNTPHIKSTSSELGVRRVVKLYITIFLHETGDAATALEREPKKRKAYRESHTHTVARRPPATSATRVRLERHRQPGWALGDRARTTPPLGGGGLATPRRVAVCRPRRCCGAHLWARAGERARADGGSLGARGTRAGGQIGRCVRAAACAGTGWGVGRGRRAPCVGRAA